MYIRTKTSKNSPRKTIQIVESFINDKGQPRQRIVQHLGVAFDDEQLRNLCSMAEKLIPGLEQRAKEEKLFKQVSSHSTNLHLMPMNRKFLKTESHMSRLC